MATGQSSADDFGVVAVASSTGGIHALIVILESLGPDLPVPVLVVQHLDPRRRTVLARRTRLPVKLAEHGETARPGTVYVAPPDHHLLVDPRGALALTSTALVHFLRPSADLLFESVAGSYGERAIVCVLSGTGSDGAAGAGAVKAHGGTVIAEDPRSAEFKGMPHAAVGTGALDFVLPLEEIAEVIRGLLGTKRR